MPQVGPSMAAAVFSLSCFLVLDQVVGNRPPVTQEEIPSGTGAGVLQQMLAQTIDLCFSICPSVDAEK